jgi:CheY-like chemotaxis protein
MKRQKSCLLVEDDPEDQEFFVEALLAVSPTTGCYAVANGEEALFTITQEGFVPDYIFTDLNMPRMDGLEFLRILRGIEKFKNIPVIIYSSHYQEKQIEIAKGLRVTAIYSKSGISALKDILRKCFNDPDNLFANI